MNIDKDLSPRPVPTTARYRVNFTHRIMQAGAFSIKEE